MKNNDRFLAIIDFLTRLRAGKIELRSFDECVAEFEDHLRHLGLLHQDVQTSTEEISVVKKEQILAQARLSFEEAKKFAKRGMSIDTYNSIFWAVRALNETGVKPNDIGMTDHMVSYLIAIANRDSATRQVATLHLRTDWKAEKREDIEKLGFTPTTVLDRVYKSSAKSRLRRLVKDLRRGKIEPNRHFQDNLSKLMSKTELTPADIGLREGEMEELVSSWYQQSITAHLVSARDPKLSVDRLGVAYEIQYLLKEWGKRPKDAGTSERELKEFEGTQIEDMSGR